MPSNFKKSLMKEFQTTLMYFRFRIENLPILIHKKIPFYFIKETRVLSKISVLASLDNASRSQKRKGRPPIYLQG